MARTDTRTPTIPSGRPIWRRAPTALRHSPALLAALALSAFLVSITAASYPLFLSASKSQLLAEQIADPLVTNYGTGITYRATRVSFTARATGWRLIDRRASGRLHRTHRRESGAGTRAGADPGGHGGRHPARRAHPAFGRGPGPVVRRHGRPRQRHDPRRRRRSGRVAAGPAGSRGAPASGRRIRTHGRRTPRDRDPGRHLSRAVHPAAIGVLADLGRRHLSDLSRLRVPPPAASRSWSTGRSCWISGRASATPRGRSPWWRRRRPIHR